MSLELFNTLATRHAGGNYPKGVARAEIPKFYEPVQSTDTTEIHA